MPQDRLETIRGGLAAFNRGDLSGAEELVTEDVEWQTTGQFPGLEGVYRGPDALEGWMATIRAEWSEFEVSLGDVLAEGEDAVVIVEQLRGRGRESGAEVEMRIYGVYRFNPEGRIRQRRAFKTPEQAMQAFETGGPA